jgi:hypothetical protein
MTDEALMAAKLKCRERYMERQPLALVEWARKAGDLPDAAVARFNVHAIGIARRLRGGRDTGQLCIQIAVLRKFDSLEQVARLGGVPIDAAMDGIPVDVVEAAPLVIEAHDDRRENEEATQTFRPLRPGCSIRHGAGAGTLSGFCRSTDEASRGRVYILSCRHVLAGFQEPLPSEEPVFLEIFQPGGPAAAASRVSPKVERLVDAMQPAGTPPRYAGDAAAAPLDPGIDIDVDNLGIGRPTGIIDLPKLSADRLLRPDKYVKFGRATGLTTGTLNVVKRDTRAVFGGRERVFDNQFIVRRLPGAAMPMSDPGDSGAMLFHADTREVAGIVIGAPKGAENNEVAVISPLVPILEALRVELII